MASLEIELDFDVSAFEKESDAYVRDVLIRASVDALNAAAEAGRLAVVEAMPNFIDRPTRFTVNAVSYLRSRPSICTGTRCRHVPTSCRSRPAT